MTLKEAENEMYYCQIRYRNACGLCKPKAERDALEKEYRKACEIWTDLHSEYIKERGKEIRKKIEKMKKKG